MDTGWRFGRTESKPCLLTIKRYVTNSRNTGSSFARPPSYMFPCISPICQRNITTPPPTSALPHIKPTPLTRLPRCAQKNIEPVPFVFGKLRTAGPSDNDDYNNRCVNFLAASPPLHHFMNDSPGRVGVAAVCILSLTEPTCGFFSRRNLSVDCFLHIVCDDGGFALGMESTLRVGAGERRGKSQGREADRAA